MRRLLLVLLSGCAADVTDVEVTLQEELTCPAVLGDRSVRSAEVDVVRQSNLLPAGGVGERIVLDPATRDLEVVFEAFAEDGVIVRGVPADAATFLRFVGYFGREWEDSSEVACGVGCPAVDGDDPPDGGVVVDFFCPGDEPRLSSFRTCLNPDVSEAPLCQE